MKQPPSPLVPSREGHQLSVGQEPVSNVLSGVRFHNTDYVKLFRQRHLAPFFLFPARARRRQESGPLQGLPGTQSVRGPRTFRSFVGPSSSIPAPLQQSSPGTSPRRPLLPLLSPREPSGSIRGRKVQHRISGINTRPIGARHQRQCQREHPAALCSEAAGRPGSKGQQSGQARQLTFSTVPPR